jgi:hypothetical protein
MQVATLICHPDTPSPAVRGIAAHIETREAGVLALRYALQGDIAALAVPEPREPAFTDGLWRHTCFEIFIGCVGSPAYVELNFSPGGEWAAYAFRDYREGQAMRDAALEPRITTRLAGTILELDAYVQMDHFALALDHGQRTIAVALSAVLEDRRGALSYWALAHPAGRPDFHHPDSRTLRLT